MSALCLCIVGRLSSGCTHSGQKESPADLTVAEIAAESPILRRNAKSVSGTRRASTKGPRADVGGRREGAYRHCVHGMLPIRHDFDEWHQVALMAYSGSWVGLSLWLHAKIAPFVSDTSAQF